MFELGQVYWQVFYHFRFQLNNFFLNAITALQMVEKFVELRQREVIVIA